ncbi:hypothetical protein N7457_002687 [Penicillium paradoxum]|uniref:uncharacterized protein n=1 Tax=Penicillium paradoxum TaxID=176176 RepID=UPI002548E41A|nr:uncharacterized protein N7457_002687 [Penicillium paradoxum]KAJ5787697.1 hypothetical protein N7457_002687 [Penicillium paradoxum]
MLSMDLASARGTKVRDIVIDRRPSTGRGKKLTLAQENVLRELYEQELPFLPEGEHPVKRFWVNLASRFREHTGREYSWLSVKRRAETWRQKSPRDDGRLHTPSADLLNGGDSTAKTSHEPLAHHPLGLQAPCDSPRPAQLQDRDSSQLQHPINPGLSDIDKNHGVSDWLQRSWSVGVTNPTQDTRSNRRSSRTSQTRARSRSPQRVSQPRYRTRSPSRTRSTEVVPRRLRHQLAFASNGPVVSHPSYSSEFGSRMGRNSSRLYPVCESQEKESTDYEISDPPKSKHKDGRVDHPLPGSPQLSEPDDLPLAPARILRRRAVAKANENHGIG